MGALTSVQREHGQAPPPATEAEAGEEEEDAEEREPGKARGPPFSFPLPPPPCFLISATASGGAHPASPGLALLARSAAASRTCW